LRLKEGSLKLFDLRKLLRSPGIEQDSVIVGLFEQEPCRCPVRVSYPVAFPLEFDESLNLTHRRDVKT
jgi:hypothetical protein